jgi:hypothetical protein
VKPLSNSHVKMEKTTENETKTEFEEVKNDDSVKLEDTNAEDGETQKKKKKKRKKKKGFHFFDFNLLIFG